MQSVHKTSVGYLRPVSVQGGRGGGGRGGGRRGEGGGNAWYMEQIRSKSLISLNQEWQQVFLFLSHQPPSIQQITETGKKAKGNKVTHPTNGLSMAKGAEI